MDKFNPDIIYIHTTNQNTIKYPEFKNTFKDVATLLNSEAQRYKLIWSSLSQFDCAIIQNNFDFTMDRSLGNLDCSDIHGKTHFINQLNNELAKSSREIKNLYINDINYLSSYIGLKSWFDTSLWHQAKYALSLSAIPEVTCSISKIINSIFGKIKNCLVLDLNNTCWGGGIGDDGLHGIVKLIKQKHSRAIKPVAKAIEFNIHYATGCCDGICYMSYIICERQIKLGWGYRPIAEAMDTEIEIVTNKKRLRIEKYEA